MTHEFKGVRHAGAARNGPVKRIDLFTLPRSEADAILTKGGNATMAATVFVSRVTGYVARCWDCRWESTRFDERSDATEATKTHECPKAPK